MSLLDKASLIITPNAYEESKLYSVVPNTTLGDMDVVRATTATRVNSAGLIEVVPRNLVTYSNTFTNAAWGSYNQLSLTANAGISPDGTNNAFLFTKNTASTVAWKLQSIPTLTSGVTYTLSVFVKKATVGNTAILRFAGGGFPPAIIYEFNFDTETITNGGSFTKLTNGWYRISGQRTATSTGNGDFQIGVTSILATDLNNVLIYGAQLEQGSLTEYFPTTTRLNIPRIDYTNGSCPSLLVEPQRTNLLVKSEEFESNSWQKINTVISANTVVSPNGTQNSDTYPADQGNLLYQQIAATTNTTYTVSLYVKLGTATNLCLIFNNAAAWNTISGRSFTSADGLNASTWKKISYTFTTPSALPSGIINFHIGGNSETGLTQSTGTVFIWGAQLELGSYPTSYIPTVASTVTRNADVISKTGISSLIGQTEGTLFCEINLPNPLSTGGKAIVIIGTSPNRIYIAKEGTTTNIFQLATQSASGFNFINSAVITTSKVKFAIAYKGSNNAFYINGSLISSASATANPTSFSNLLIGDTSPQTNTDIKINSVQLYKTRLSNSELAQLTTL